MFSVSKLVKADQTLADLVHEFGSLAEKYRRAEKALKADQSLDVHRRDVDSIFSIRAAICLLAAVEKGFIQSADSEVWNLIHVRANRFKNRIAELSRLQDQWKELAETDSRISESPANRDPLPVSVVAAAYYSRADLPASLEPIDLDALRRQSEAQLQKVAELQRKLELESDIDLTSDEGRIDLKRSWEAFVRLELIPSHVNEFRSDWKERLLPPEFFVLIGAKDSGQQNPKQSLVEKLPGETKDDQSRYSVSAKADIYATACRVVAKMLKVEWDRRHAENGQLQTSGQYETADACANLTSTENPLRSTSEAVVEHRIEDSGEHYLFHGFGEKCSLSKSVGVERLVAVVTSSDRQLSIFDLYQIGSKRRATGRSSVSPEPQIDRDAIGMTERRFPVDETDGSRFDEDTPDSTWERVQGLIEERDLARMTGNDEEAQRLTKVLDTLYSTEKNLVKKARDSVRNTIDKTIERIDKKQFPNLWDHFFQSVDLSDDKRNYVFAPASSNIVWTIFKS